MTYIWRNGEWIQAETLHIAPGDRGLLHGLGLFETLLAIDGRAVFPDQHLARLRSGCRQLGWNPDIPDFTGLVASLGMGRFRIRLTLTGGTGPLDDLSLGADHLWMLTASPAAEAPLTTCANLSPFTRNERSAIAGLKCASYAENSVALDHARRLGFEETVFLNSAGNLCEAAASNLFLVKDGVLLTPSLASGCLRGITRSVVIELAARRGIPCRESDLPAGLIHEADEIFLTSSIRGVMGVSRFQHRRLPAGPLTGQLLLAWNGEVHRECGG